MSRQPEMQGLSLDQAPPLSIPMSFFLTAPIALMVAGVLLVVTGAGALTERWASETMAIAHLGTLGFLAMVMLGALYQMIPVVAGARVPAARAAHFVHAALVLGAGTLVFGFATGGTIAFRVAGGLVIAALVAFFGPVVLALARAPAGTDTVAGMRLAVASFVAVVSLGATLLLGRAGVFWVEPWGNWLIAHVGLGVVGWIGGLVVAVSWQLIPMFFLTEPFPRWSIVVSLVALAVALIGTPIALAFAEEPEPILLSLAPAALAVWVLHPILASLLIARRRRKRVGEAVRFWWAGLALAPLVLAAAIGAYFLEAPRWTVLFGWLALPGWAGLIVHGMLTRIVPFLVWFHRYSRRVGFEPTPSMKDLLPDARARIGLFVHAGTIVVGSAAIVTGSTPLAQAAGVGLFATGVLIASALARTLRRMR